MGTESRLTDEQIQAVVSQVYGGTTVEAVGLADFARAIESAVRSQDEALLRQAREALNAAYHLCGSTPRKNGYLERPAYVAPEQYAHAKAALSALNARLGDSDQEKSDASK